MVFWQNLNTDTVVAPIKRLFKVQECMHENTDVIASYKWYQLKIHQKHEFVQQFIEENNVNRKSRIWQQGKPICESFLLGNLPIHFQIE